MTDIVTELVSFLMLCKTMCLFWLLVSHLGIGACGYTLHHSKSTWWRKTAHRAARKCRDRGKEKAQRLGLFWFALLLLL